MGFLSKIKGLFTKTEVTEESFEYTSIQQMLKEESVEEASEEKTSEEDVVFKCDQMADAIGQMQELQIEYDLVTSYFSDIQVIEEIPKEEKNRIVAVAKRISALEKETSSFLQSEDRISDEKFRMIKGMEKELTDIFARLNELEDMDYKIKRDMKHLEAEKNTLKYVKESIIVRQKKLRSFILLFATLAVLTVFMLALAGALTGNNLFLPILLILLVVAGMAVLTVNGYRKLSYEYKLSEAKENRAINLMNKVKIKYVNNTATLEYLYNKYQIKNLRELEYLYDQYQTMLEEVRKYQKSAGDLRELSDALSKLLFAYGVKDPDIWVKQTQALVDHREMVEVKHSLNVRRQKLREQIAYNENLKLEALNDIQGMLKKNPGLSGQIQKELELNGIDLQADTAEEEEES